MKPNKHQQKPLRKIKPEEDAPIESLRASVAERLEMAVASGHFLIAIAHLNGTSVKLWRKTGDFPPEDFNTVVDMLDTDLRKERRRLLGEDPEE